MSSGTERGTKPQYAQIADILEGRIVEGSYGVNGALPTFNKLCDEFQVSIVTVNKAIEQLDLRGRVIRRRGKGVFALPVDQRPPTFVFESPATQRNIGLIIPDLANPYFASMAKKIQSLLHDERCTVLTQGTDGSLQLWNQYIQRLIQDRVDGVIVVPLDTSAYEKEEVLWQLKISRIPLVYINNAFDRVPSDHVSCDVGFGVREIAKYLVAAGHTRFGCVSAQPYMNFTRRKMTVFRETLADMGKTITDDDLIVSTLEHDEGGTDAAIRLLSRPAESRPTAIFATNDIIAFGVMSAAATLGLSVPEDVSVVGFDNIEASRFTSPPLTTIEQPVDRIAEMAAKIMLARVEKTLPPDFQQYVFKPHLIERGSCQALANR